MAFTFPTSPSEGDTFEHAGFQYEWRTSPDRWAGNGFLGIDNSDPFADFLTTTYAGPATLTTNHIASFDEPPYTNGNGISDPTTGGMIGLSDLSGQGNGMLFPTTVMGSASAIMGVLDSSDFSGTSNAKAYLADGSTYGCGFQSTIGPSGQSFNSTGSNYGAVGMAFNSIADDEIKNITRIDFRIPSGGTGTEGNVFAILVESTVVTVLTSTGAGNSGGSTNYHNYRYGELDEAFVAA